MSTALWVRINGQRELRDNLRTALKEAGLTYAERSERSDKGAAAAPLGTAGPGGAQAEEVQRAMNDDFAASAIVLELMGARVREVDDLSEGGIWVEECQLLFVDRSLPRSDRAHLVERMIREMTLGGVA